MPHEVEQGIEDARREQHGLAAPQQHPFGRVKAEIVELVNL
jgi:hypothetical protein